jgi:hypothetical protein
MIKYGWEAAVSVCVFRGVGTVRPPCMRVVGCYIDVIDVNSGCPAATADICAGAVLEAPAAAAA